LLRRALLTRLGRACSGPGPLNCDTRRIGHHLGGVTMYNHTTAGDHTRDAYCSYRSRRSEVCTCAGLGAGSCSYSSRPYCMDCSALLSHWAQHIPMPLSQRDSAFELIRDHLRSALSQEETLHLNDWDILEANSNGPLVPAPGFHHLYAYS
jgi:hypothetical protein